MKPIEAGEAIAGFDILVPANLDVLVLAELTHHIKKAWLIRGLDDENPFCSGRSAGPVQGKGRALIQADGNPSQMSAITAAGSGLQQEAVHAESLDKSSTSLF
jgi:hypothetical protein